MSEGGRRWQRYVDSLPRGLDSFPACLMKAAIPRMLHDSCGKPVIDAEVPEPIRDILQQPISSFVPGVHARALLLAQVDLWNCDDDAVVHGALLFNRKFLSSPMYRALFWLISPERFLKNVGDRWRQFNRGVELTPVSIESDARQATLELRGPPLMDPLLLVRMHLTGIQAAVEMASGQSVRCDCSPPRDGVSLIKLRWGGDERA